MKGDGWAVPQLGTFERIGVGKDGGHVHGGRDAGVRVPLAGQGQVLYMAAQPGLASLWWVLQPPIVSDRRPATHWVPTALDPGAARVLGTVLDAPHIKPC